MSFHPGSQDIAEEDQEPPTYIEPFGFGMYYFDWNASTGTPAVETSIMNHIDIMSQVVSRQNTGILMNRSTSMLLEIIFLRMYPKNMPYILVHHF